MGGFNDLSLRSQVLTFTVLCVLIVVGISRLVLEPASAALARRESRAAVLQGDMRRLRITAAMLPVFLSQARALETSLIKATAILPSERDPQGVLRDLQALASESAVDISSFAPAVMTARTQYSEWPVQIGLEGSYHDLGRFFGRVATMSRLISVSDLRIRTNGKATTKNTLAATCIATTFTFNAASAPEARGSGVPAMTGGAK